MSKLVFPARAGMSRWEHLQVGGYDRVPRASGDEPNPTVQGNGVDACSPRERG